MKFSKNHVSKIVLLLVSVTFLCSPVVSQTPNHPLSDISPMDVPLNLEGQSIVDSTGQLVLDSETRINSDLDMNGNSILNYFSDSCPSGSVVADVTDEGELVCKTLTASLSDVYVNRSGDSMTGDLDMNDSLVRRVADPVTDTDAVNQGFVEGNYLNLQGGMMNGSIWMEGYEIHNFFGEGCSSGLAVIGVNRDGSYDCMSPSASVSEMYVNRSGDSMTGDLDMNDSLVRRVADPVAGGDAVNQGFVDTNYLNIEGGGMEGKIDMQGNNIRNIGSDGNFIDIGDVAGGSGITESEAYGVEMGWDTDDAFFGLRDYGSDRKDVVINNEQSADNIRFQSSGDDKMIIEGGGNVGIGNINPSSSLDVSGDVEINDGNPSGTNSIKGDRMLYAGDETEVELDTTSYELIKELTLLFDSEYAHNPEYVNIIANIRDADLRIVISGDSSDPIVLSGTGIQSTAIDTSTWSDGTYDVDVEIRNQDGDTGVTSMNDVIEFYYVK